MRNACSRCKPQTLFGSALIYTNQSCCTAMFRKSENVTSVHSGVIFLQVSESESNTAILCQNDAPVKTFIGVCQVVCAVTGMHICCGR